MSSVGVVGGGIVGMSAAWYLHRSGHDVTIIDKGDILSGCSWGNAGMIVPSHFIPLAAPGMISKGVRWMFDSSSPFYVRPHFDPKLFRWGWHFYRSSRAEKVERSAPVLRDLSLYSKTCYQELGSLLSFDLYNRGLLMLFRKQETGEEEIETVEMAHRLGLDAKVMSLEEVQELEPGIKIKALGGVYFRGDMHLSPSSVMTAFRDALVKGGVRILVNTVVTGFQCERKVITGIYTGQDLIAFDEVVLAAGAWSPELCSQLDLNLPVQGGKGYSFVMKEPQARISIPTLLLDDRVAVTPLGNDVRFGGTMEIGGIDPTINMNRVRGIVNAIPRYYPDLRVEVPSAQDVWHGFRPCSPDGLPFLGRSKRISNLIIATGHGMMGMSLGPGTGRIVADLVNGLTPAVAIDALNPERFD